MKLPIYVVSSSNYTLSEHLLYIFYTQSWVEPEQPRCLTFNLKFQHQT